MDEVPLAMEPTNVPRDARPSDRSWCDDCRVAVQGAGAHANAGKATTDVTTTEPAHVAAAERAARVAAAERAAHVAAASSVTAATAAVSESNRGQQRDCQGD